MKKFVALLMREKRPGMNGKIMTPTFFELYAVYINTSFIHVATDKYFKKLISKV